MKAAAVRWAWHTVGPTQRRNLPGLTRCVICSNAGYTTSSHCPPKAMVSAQSIENRRLQQLRSYVSLSDRDQSTIYALSTAPGRAAIAIIRISGPDCLHIYGSLCPGKEIPRPRYATLRTLYRPNISPSIESILDTNTLILHFPASRTVTGEDVLELHVHGGPAIVKAVLAAISECNSSSHAIRYAELGEFTRRAFMNDRLDLTQVEALGDVLSATTEQQRKVSVRGATNTLAKTYERWRQQLLYARAEVEALIDFSEDQHFDESPAELCASVSSQIRVLQQLVLAHVQNAMKGELLRHGVSIALLGAPNVGKSSLLNHIVGREAAIVSHEEGTTRDVVEVGIDLGGFFCRLGDTAGLRRNTMDPLRIQQKIGMIEEEGMRRSKERAAESDVVILVLSFETRNGVVRVQMDPDVISTAAGLVRTKDNVVVVINKSDLASGTAVLNDAISATMAALPGIPRERIHIISCLSAQMHPSTCPTESLGQLEKGGMQSFLHALIEYFRDLTAAVSLPEDSSSGDPSVWQDSLGASERHRLLLLHCAKDLEAFQASVAPKASASVVDDAMEADIVVAAEHLRSAADCLAKITGKGEAGDVEEVLGVVFEKFCVGK